MTRHVNFCHHIDTCEKYSTSKHGNRECNDICKHAMLIYPPFFFLFLFLVQFVCPLVFLALYNTFFPTYINIFYHSGVSPAVLSQGGNYDL
jgi:hypothetical protein